MRLILIIIFFNSLSYWCYADKNNTDVDFTSDSITVDEKNEIMSAIGNVIIKDKNRTIKADLVKYDQKLDKAVASGNVIIEEIDGSIFESDEVILTEQFKAITVIPLFGKFKNKSFIKAKSLTKKSDGSGFFKRGIYTACDCDLKNNKEPPIWQLNAEEIKRDKTEKMLYYKNVI